MNASETAAIQRLDYQAPDYLIPKTELSFRLDPTQTEVRSRLEITRAEGVSEAAPLVLNGAELDLKSVRVNGESVGADSMEKTDSHLSLFNLPDAFTLEIVTEISPDTNTALEGLYRSSGNYCTQCEAEGFRKITYFLDRPDVLSVYTVTIIGDKASLPVLLSNGDPISNQALEDGLHEWVWHDPHPKPSYLFALVAGDLAVVEDSFTTQSGREVLLQIYVQAHNQTLCDFAMASLKRSMVWDEKVYGLEYDLDRFMIVAVDDFNMGAMENKGLNVFNSKYVLASVETATDSDFIGVEAVIAHEYFHNWTGNRVTCRDWFQLSLKEGLTVFRDQCFTADHHSPTVKRIQDVQLLRAAQFAEDASPMAHPIRPDSYVEINNFYTLTVYEKGAEVIRMFHTLLGEDAYRAGIDLYFERHDGQAVTCDDFIDAMADASGRDLTQFRQWYAQAGTPTLTVRDDYDAASQRYSLRIDQKTPDTPGQKNKPPLHIPVDVALLDSSGATLSVHLESAQPLTSGGGVLLDLTEPSQTWEFSKVPTKPVLSLLRQFSAPVKADYHYEASELAFLMAHDTDTFNRWEASQRLAEQVLTELEAGDSTKLPEYLDAYEKVLNDADIDSALKAEMLRPPAYSAMAQTKEKVDVHKLLDARESLIVAIAKRFTHGLLEEVERHRPLESTDPAVLTDAAMANRSLSNTALSILSTLPADQWLSIAHQRYQSCSTMTERLGALAAICTQPGAVKEECLEHFHHTFKHHKLVIDKWFAAQSVAEFDGAFDSIKALVDHPSFDASNPNRLRSVFSIFANGNPRQFHQTSGAGYAWIADAVLDIDRRNPQIASGLVSPLTRWQRYVNPLSSLMRNELERIAETSSLSPDVFELVSKGLAQTDT